MVEGEENYKFDLGVKGFNHCIMATDRIRKGTWLIKKMFTFKNFYFYHSAMPSVAATMNNIRESTSMPCLVSEDGSTTAHATTEKGMLSQSQSFDDTKERSLQHSRVEIVRLTMFRKVCKFGYNNQ